MPAISLRDLLEAGVHFGHQTKRWNPKMKPYIFGAKNGIYIIDLQKTTRMFDEAYRFVTNLSKQGKKVLFVGTKKQAQEIIRKEAERCGMYYINNRWLGGMLTNFSTIKGSIDRLNNLEKMQAEGKFGYLTKKEVLTLENDIGKLNKTLGGIKNMKGLPDVIFVIDVKKEHLAIHEARRLGIPIVAVVDTNCDPEGIQYVIPGNDDALKSIQLFTSRIADACLEGQHLSREYTNAPEGSDKPASMPDVEVVMARRMAESSFEGSVDGEG
jgi:small subunit ribosomal protein S2